MATTRKPAKKPVTRPKPAAKAAKAKPARKSAPAAKPVRAAVKPARPAKPAAKAQGKPAPKVAARPVPKVAAKAPAKPSVKAPVKAAAKAPVKVVGKPALKGPVKPDPKAGKALVRPIGRLVPAKPMPGRPLPGTGKSKQSNRPPAEVRPLGVLPPESMVKTRERPRPSAPLRPLPRPAPPPKPMKGDMETGRLTKDALEYFENRLREERAKIMKEMGHLETTILKVNPRDSAGELSGYSFHMADAGTDSMEREISFDIASKEGRLLREIDDALRRVYNGVYGLCEASGKPIARARLEALPWARYTVEEQEKIEKEQRAGRVPKDD